MHLLKLKDRFINMDHVSYVTVDERHIRFVFSNAKTETIGTSDGSYSEQELARIKEYLAEKAAYDLSAAG